MKIFGWKAAGREELRPALSRYEQRYGGAATGEWPASYEAQIRDGYLRNAIAQRSVRLVAQGLGGAPLNASDPALIALVSARSAGQALLETVAAQLLLHGIRPLALIAWGWSRWRFGRAALRRSCQRIMRCAAGIVRGWQR